MDQWVKSCQIWIRINAWPRANQQITHPKSWSNLPTLQCIKWLTNNDHIDYLTLNLSWFHVSNHQHLQCFPPTFLRRCPASGGKRSSPWLPEPKLKGARCGWRLQIGDLNQHGTMYGTVHSGQSEDYPQKYFKIIQDLWWKWPFSSRFILLGDRFWALAPKLWPWPVLSPWTQRSRPKLTGKKHRGFHKWGIPKMIGL